MIYSHLYSYTLTKHTTAGMGATANMSDTTKPSPSSNTRVTFINSQTSVEVEEGEDAVLECGLRNLASHHMVSQVYTYCSHVVHLYSRTVFAGLLFLCFGLCNRIRINLGEYLF